MILRFNCKRLFNNKSLMFFLISQGVSNLGDAFQLIAAVSLLRRLTGSGLQAAFGLVCFPVLSILFSNLGGYLGDIKNEKHLLVLIDMLRGFVAVLFILGSNVLRIYALVTLLSLLDIFYNPPKRKFLTCIVDRRRLIAANSVLNGISGGMFIVGPILAGFVIITFGTNIAFIVNSFSFFISAVLIAITNYKKNKPSIFKATGISKNSSTDLLCKGVVYCINTYSIRKIIMIATIICFCTTSVNIAFYPFAFDYLKITDKTWGFMMSIFYGASLLAMPLTLMLAIKMQTFYKKLLPATFLAISLIWFLYANTGKVLYIMGLQLLEGTLFAFINIVLTSHLQSKSSKEYLGRVIGINDFINNFGKIMGIGCTYILLTFTEPYNVFIFCAAVFSVYSIFMIFTISSKKLNLLC